MPADERHVDRVSPATTLAGLHQGAAARVERVLVDRAVEHLRLPGEAVLGAVAVVHVPVDDHHPFVAQSLARPAGADGHVVEQAEAHGLVTLRMVPGWPDQAETVVDLAAIEPLDAIDHRSGGTQRRAVGRVRGARIGIQVESGVGGGGSHLPDVFAAVVALHGGNRRAGKIGKDELPGNLGPVQFAIERAQPFRRLQVVAAGLVSKKQRVPVDSGAAHQRSLLQARISFSVHSRSSGMSWGRAGSRSTTWQAKPRPTRTAPGASRARNRS